MPKKPCKQHELLRTLRNSVTSYWIYIMSDISNKSLQQIHPQLLELPICITPMQYGVNSQGVIQLIQSQFKCRYSGLTNLSQIPGKKLIRKKATVARELSKRVKAYQKLKRMASINKPKVYLINAKQVKSRIVAFVENQSHGKELYFWTVTFPENTNDASCMLLLNKWLTRLRQERMLKSYLWVTERQQNGTLHYHIAIPHKMDVKKANRFMRAGIMTCINQGLISWTRTDAAKYNGVHISKHRTTNRVINFAKGKNRKALINYITKYATKNTERFNQLAWHNSRDFSNVITRINFTHEEIIKLQLAAHLNTEKPIIKDHYNFYRWKGSPPDEIMQHFRIIQSIINSYL